MCGHIVFQGGRQTAPPDLIYHIQQSIFLLLPT